MYKSIEAKETPFQKGIDSRVSQEKMRLEKKKKNGVVLLPCKCTNSHFEIVQYKYYGMQISSK